MESILFPFSDYWWLYAAFTSFVLLLLAVDLGWVHRKAHAVSFREATVWSVVWIALALLFGLLLQRYALAEFSGNARFAGLPGFDPAIAARQIWLEYLTGYVVEKALSVDNIFVFVVVFSYFAIPAAYQHRVLFYGILGALLFRAAFIALGSVLMQYHAIVILFGVFLLLTGAKLFFIPERSADPSQNLLIRLLRKVLPVTPELHGQRFLVREGGAWHATPLLVALLFVESTDIVFAVDSVPAIFALTREPLVVFTSNVFAILGLRALYFMLAGAIENFHMLRYGLALVLVFVGLKMVWLNDWYGGKFPIGVSLSIILSLMAVSVLLSFLIPRPKTASEQVIADAAKTGR